MGFFGNCQCDFLFKGGFPLAVFRYFSYTLSFMFYPSYLQGIVYLSVIYEGK